MRSYKEFKSLAETAKQEYEILEGAAWTKKAGKNKEGGRDGKGMKSYETAYNGTGLEETS